MTAALAKYVFKPHPHRSHSVILRWLPDGWGRGSIIISVPNVAHVVIRLMLLLGRFDYIDRGILDVTQLRFFTERFLRGLMTDAGLSIERFTATPALLYQVLPERSHRPWLAATHSVNALIARRLPRLFGYQFIVLARPKGAPP